MTLEATKPAGALPVFSARDDESWLTNTVEALRHVGCAVVTDVLSDAQVDVARKALYNVQARIHQELGVERLERAGEMGVMRLPMKYDPYFFTLLEIPEMLQIIDATVSPTAILHVQNGFILPSFPPGETPKVFQNKFHMDFPRVLNGYVASINVMISIDPFTAANGGTLAVAGTHHKLERPDEGYLQANAVPVECPPGSLLVFDSTLWHAAGQNLSGQDRLAVNHQFTRSWVKQQMDYVRALGDDVVQVQQPRTQQLLGWYTRVVTSLDEYYRPGDQRLYRSGQG